MSPDAPEEARRAGRGDAPADEGTSAEGAAREGAPESVGEDGTKGAPEPSGAAAGSAAEDTRGDSAGPEADTVAEADTGPKVDTDPEIKVRDAVSAPDAAGRPRRTTRRFPLFTRDTARPEGGGRAAASDAPAPARQWPVLMVLGVVALGLLLTALDLFRIGTMLIGLALLVGAVMRWVMPDVGMLAVRSRFTDIVTYGVLGFAIVLLAMMVQPRPWLEIPVLDDALHFTIRT